MYLSLSLSLPFCFSAHVFSLPTSVLRLFIKLCHKFLKVPFFLNIDQNQWFKSESDPLSKIEFSHEKFS